MIVEIIVQSIIRLTFLLRQCLERLGIETIDARMIAARLVRIFYKEHIGLVTGSERCSMTFLIEGDSTGYNLLGSERHGRVKVPQQSTLGIAGYLPNAEEAKQVIDTVGIEVVGHLSKALSKPFVTFCCHGTPIIGRKSPILTIACEGIGWSTSLAFETEETRMTPCLNACSADADRNVALKHYAMTMSIISSMLELLM